MNFAYALSLAGILKIVELVFNFIGLICIAATGTSSRGDAFLGASAGGIIITGILLIICILDVKDAIKVPWMMIEMIYCCVWALFYIVTSALVIDMGPNGYIAGGVFGLLATITYIVDAYDKFRQRFQD